MDYFTILNLNREPFSNSPDPDFFFRSRQHFICLQKLELAIRLQRGLNVIIGEVGTGKTTICRQLYRRLSNDEEMEPHLILDPTFDSAAEFLASVAGMVGNSAPPKNWDQWRLEEIIKHHLFHKGLEERKIVTLIIDEAQKLTSYFIEILREFLNYETNEHKLLQIVLFAQEEFMELLVTHSNFSDRINYFSTLRPLNFKDTRLLIEYRLKKSSNPPAFLPLFTWSAYLIIYIRSKGYPRKIIHLCHQSLLTMIIQKRRQIGYNIVRCSAPTIQISRQKRLVKMFNQSILISIVVLGTTIGSGVFIFNKLAQHFQTANALNISRHRIVSDSRPVASDANQIQVESKEKEKINVSINLSKNTGIKPGKSMPPFILGAILITKREDLTSILKVVYGISSDQYLESLITLNPHLENINTVAVGTIIRFPAICTVKNGRIFNAFRLEIRNFTTLNRAVKAYKSEFRKNNNIRMIAYWTPSLGLRFSILWNAFFYDKDLAQKKLTMLKTIWGNDVKIVRDWQKDTLFFSALTLKS